MTSESKEKQALDCIARGLKSRAVALLYELILDYAHSGDFKKAEHFRQLLIQTDPMALTEIVQSGELIDKLKSEAIDAGHRLLWKDLYDAFSEEETSAFYFMLKPVRLPPGKVIIQQGRHNDKLFLIHSGTLKVIHLSGTEELFLKEAGPREIVGQETFFSISIATATVITTCPVHLSFLTLQNLSELKNMFPGFDIRFMELCSRFAKTLSSTAMKSQKIERRQHQRYPVEGKTALFFPDADGKPKDHPLYGVLEDLSQGGASFLIRSSTREKARSLLGRTAILKFILKTGGSDLKETRKGRILALKDHLFSEYSISFKFSNPLSLETLRRFSD